MKISYDNIIYVRKDLKYGQSESENVGFNMELFSKIERGGKGIMPTQVPVFIMSLLWHINTELYWLISCLLSRFQWLVVQMHISGKYIKWRRLDRQRNRQKYIVIPHQTKINERSNEIYIHMMCGFNPIAKFAECSSVRLVYNSFNRNINTDFPVTSLTISFIVYLGPDISLRCLFNLR